MYFFSRRDIVTLYLVVIDKNYSAVDEESPGDGNLLLSEDGLLSAINEPRQTFDGKDLYPDVFTKAGALMRSLILNHPFYDGNKRVSAARRNLKEVGGKPPARRTETPYEARDSWMSLHRKAKSVLPRAVQSKWGGRTAPIPAYPLARAQTIAAQRDL